jgi:anthranilate phosphoribosyltransferase
MKTILNKLFNHEQLNYKEALDILLKIGTGQFNNTEIGSFLTVFLMRNISVDELLGFRNALLELCVKVDLSEHNTIDLCGTGGDEKDTFNISTLSSFVVAGAGYKVAKHGNYGISSNCGSSNVLEYLGYKFSNNQDKIKREIDSANITFLHAPLFHPAMKYVAPVRHELKQKTFFNMLGPLVNPSFPKNQAVGVYNLEVARIYSYSLQKTTKNFTIIHSLDGYDEISLTGETKVISNKTEQLLSPQYFGFDTIKAEQIIGGEDVKSSAKIFVNILENNATIEQKNVVLANSAIAIKTINPENNINDCIEEAKISIESGKALKSLKIFLEN